MLAARSQFQYTWYPGTSLQGKHQVRMKESQVICNVPVIVVVAGVVADVVLVVTSLLVLSGG